VVFFDKHGHVEEESDSSSDAKTSADPDQAVFGSK
jgi:hypothetical protein